MGDCNSKNDRYGDRGSPYGDGLEADNVDTSNATFIHKGPVNTLHAVGEDAFVSGGVDGVRGMI